MSYDKKRKPPKAFTDEETERICMNCVAGEKCHLFKEAVRLSKVSGGDVTLTFGCTEFNDG